MADGHSCAGELGTHWSRLTEDEQVVSKIRSRLDEIQCVDFASATFGAGENVEDGVQRLLVFRVF